MSAPGVRKLRRIRNDMCLSYAELNEQIIEHGQRLGPKRDHGGGVSSREFLGYNRHGVRLRKAINKLDKAIDALNEIIDLPSGA